MLLDLKKVKCVILKPHLNREDQSSKFLKGAQSLAKLLCSLNSPSSLPAPCTHTHKHKTL